MRQAREVAGGKERQAVAGAELSLEELADLGEGLQVMNVLLPAAADGGGGRPAASAGWP